LLREIGIPDEHDALAIYFRWLRQARYIREEAGPELPSSVRSVAASDIQQRPSSQSRISTGVQFNGASLSYDLLCVGARFDEAGAGAQVAGYASELDILG
jgi:hypothetical protein